MVNLIWKKKVDISVNLETLKKKYSNFFESFIVDSYLEDFDIPVNSFSKEWKNKLFWGENKEVISYLLNNFEDKIDLIYIDPPFFSGINYEIEVTKDDKIFDSIAYYDHWEKDLDSYLQMIYESIVLFKKLLSKTGLVFIHLDWHASHYIRLILDEVFGDTNFVNDIVWYYYNKYSSGKKNLPRAHDNILVYSKSNKYTLNEIRLPRKKPRKQLMRVNVNGVLKNLKDKDGHVKYRVVNDKKLDDVWRIPCLQPASKEWTGFPTQKHHELLERIIRLGSKEGDLIADFFCGSGTSLLMAEKLKRKWIGCDISEYSIYLTRNRILNYQSESQTYYPLEILTHLNTEKREIIATGFFEKQISIKRKK
ncbi:MAG: site-specific DNA-methyltransferase [Candidatus Lokiarchaeota archaeon]|nr:site-specific DNA-methyltransferase [Candidatus Lokiarchaeota archaeon]